MLFWVSLLKSCEIAYVALSDQQHMCSMACLLRIDARIDVAFYLRVQHTLSCSLCFSRREKCLVWICVLPIEFFFFLCHALQMPWNASDKADSYCLFADVLETEILIFLAREAIYTASDHFGCVILWATANDIYCCWCCKSWITV